MLNALELTIAQVLFLDVVLGVRRVEKSEGEEDDKEDVEDGVPCPRAGTALCAPSHHGGLCGKGERASELLGTGRGRLRGDDEQT